MNFARFKFDCKRAKEHLLAKITGKYIINRYDTDWIVVNDTMINRSMMVDIKPPHDACWTVIS